MCAGTLPGESVEEVWRQSTTYPTILASSIGRVKGPRGTASYGYIHKQTGYMMFGVKARTEGVRQSRAYVHRIVADAFLGPCSDGLEVNHRNSFRGDNRIVNLEYVSRRGNIRHSQAAGRFSNPPRGDGENHGMAKLTARQVAEIKELFVTKPELNNRQIGDMYGVTRTAIRYIKTGKSWSSPQAISQIEGSKNKE